MQLRTTVSPKTHPLLRSFERHLKAENKSPNTLGNYLMASRMFIEFCEEEHLPAVTEVSREHVELWLESLYLRVKPHTVRSYFTSLRAFFNWLRDEDEISKHPMERIKEPSVSEVPKDIASENEIALVLAKMEREKRWRDCALIAVLYDTGLRASELADIETTRCDLDSGLILIPHTKGKRVRTVRISAKAIRYLDRYQRQPRPDREWLFNGRKGKLTRSGVYRAVRRCFEEIGVKGIIGAHDMRHTSASHVVGKMSESAMLKLYGWTDASMARHYAAQMLEKAALEEHQTASPLERLPKPKR